MFKGSKIGQPTSAHSRINRKTALIFVATIINVGCEPIYRSSYLFQKCVSCGLVVLEIFEQVRNDSAKKAYSLRDSQMIGVEPHERVPISCWEYLRFRPTYRSKAIEVDGETTSFPIHVRNKLVQKSHDTEGVKSTPPDALRIPHGPKYNHCFQASIFVLKISCFDQYPTVKP